MSASWKGGSEAQELERAVGAVSNDIVLPVDLEDVLATPALPADFGRLLASIDTRVAT